MDSSSSSSNSSSSNAAAIDLFSGMCAGTINVVVGLPMDTIKVKMQTFPKENPGVWHTLKSVVRTEGFFRGLYAGCIPSLMANVGENAILFLAYGQCQKIVAKIQKIDDPNDLTPLSNALAGSSAAVFSAMWLCPTEHIKCQLQVRRELSKRNPNMTMVGPFQLTRDIIRKDGIKELFRGIKPTWMRELPGYFSFFGGYEVTKVAMNRWVPKENPEDELGLLPQMFCGAMAGVCFWTSIFPFDSIKSRIQVLGIKESIPNVARMIYKENGLYGFYKGWTPAVLRAFPATASLLATYEYVSSSLKKYPNA